MLAFTVRKLAISLFTLFGVAVVLFILVRVVPGDPADAILGQFPTDAERQRILEQYRLDQSLPVQFGVWLREAVQGDLGYSWYTREPVTRSIADALPITLQLALMALAFALIVGIPLGILAAIRRGKLLDYLCSGFGVLGVSIPNFWLGAMLILIFAFYLRIMPSAGVPRFTEDPLGNLQAMILPTLALGTAVAAVVMRMTRSSMLEVLNQDYVRTAKAKGLAPNIVVTRHALRNALIPILTITGIQTGYLLGGSVVIEQVFGLRGVGWLVFNAATNRDYFLLQAVVLFIAAVFITINLVVDLVYGLVDPRMRKT
ncbi:ABC transporter permease [Phycisphaerales bacterium AB-hyl4]|uniref:ABC transporter permease n=1 Tax=Natronomicrosphaera hydrolytica TaxID=3242702 RepID=A0ABV4U4L0_9BACT